MTRNTAIDRAINSIDEPAWTPVCYPGDHWTMLWRNAIGYSPPTTATL